MAPSVCTDVAKPYFCIAAFDPDTVNMLGSWAPEGQKLLSPYVTVAGDSVILPTTGRHVSEVQRLDDAKGTTFSALRDIDLTITLPQNHGVVRNLRQSGFR